MDWRAMVRLTGAGLVALGGIGVVAALFVPWSWAGLAKDPPDATTWVVILALVPVTSAGMALLAMRRDDETATLRARLEAARGGGALSARTTADNSPTAGRSIGAPLTAAGAALLAGGIATVVLLDITPDEGIRAGGPLTVLACAAAAAGWLLLLPIRRRSPLLPARRTPLELPIRRTPPRRAPIPIAAASAVLLLVGLGAVPAVGWYTEGRFVRHTTSTALPALPSAPPSQLDRYRWQAPSDPFRLIVEPVAAGRHVIVPEGGGVRALDAVTGHPLWSYERDDVTRDEDLAGVVVTSDGLMTVLSYHFFTGALVVALDTATGQERWRRELRMSPVAGLPRLVDGGEVLLLDNTALGGELVALNRRDGLPLWRWSTAKLENGCREVATAVAVAGPVAALLAGCRGRPEADMVIALSTTDGRQRWTWRPPVSAGTRPLGLELPIHSAGDRFWVAYSRTSADEKAATRSAALLNADTGAMTAEHPLPSEQLEHYRFPLVADGTIIYPGEPAIGVDLATGRVRWKQRMTEFAGWAPIDAVSRDGIAYLLLGPAEDAADDPARPALLLLALDVATGQVRARQPYDPSGCGSSCGRNTTARLMTGPGLLVVGSLEKDGTRLRGIG
ncbi:PQQ-binding-like beta-propeller repeat protein [Nonomuraea sp. NPDC049028]|uniref:outer membrane protein assembly factor BamB family protein n=1 Tax=Nonomuraea sp. NPDC049028 TaxID=3364348 RepID=UPI00371E57B1